MGVGLPLEGAWVGLNGADVGLQPQMRSRIVPVPLQGSARSQLDSAGDHCGAEAGFSRGNPARFGFLVAEPEEESGLGCARCCPERCSLGELG